MFISYLLSDVAIVYYFLARSTSPYILVCHNIPCIVHSVGIRAVVLGIIAQGHVKDIESIAKTNTELS